MFRTRDQNNRDQRYSSVPETEGDGSGEWGNRLILQPVKDDGRRQRTTTSVPSGLELTTPTGYPNRWIVGPGPGIPSPWSSLIGQLVSWDGTSWTAEAEQLVGALVYSYKRDEYLELINTIQNDIQPALTPAIVTSVSGAILRFWFPQSLIDTFHTSYKGSVTSITTQSAVWVLRCYERYVVRTDDATLSTYGNYISTYIADIISNSGKHIVQPAKEGDLIWVEDQNNFFYFDGTSWVVMSSGNTAFYGAEGRQGADGLGTKELTAAVVNTYQPIAFDLSAITNLTYCPPSFFADDGDTFTIPRYGVYAVGYSGFRIQYTGSVPDQQIYLGIRVNGTLVQEAMLPHVDDYEGEAWHGIFELDLNDEVTFEFKCTGADWDSPFTILNGSNGFVYTVDAKGGNGELVPHALNDHTDTNFPSPTTGQVIGWNGTAWVNVNLPAASPHTIIGSTHSDTVLTGSLANGQFLKRVSGNWTNAAAPTFEELSDTTWTSLAIGDIAQWNGTAWVNIPASSLTGAHTLDSHSNVNTSGKVTGSNLRWNGSAWVVYTPTLAGLSDVNISGPVNGQGLIYSGGQWTNGTITASVAACYFGAVLTAFPASGTTSPPAGWNAYSIAGTWPASVASGGWIFFGVPVSGTYELIVTGSVVLNWGTGTWRYGVYLNNTSSPLGNEIPAALNLGGAVQPIAVHATAYLTVGGNRMGFAILPTAGVGGIVSANINMTMKKIGD